MTLILIVGGTIAALLLFRWARTLALIAVAAAAIYWMTLTGHAQEPMVQCSLGSSAQVTPSSVCSVLKDGFAKLQFGGNPIKMRDTVWDCAVVITHHVRPGVQPTGNPGFGPPMEFIPICTKMMQNELYARAQGR